jgi:glutamate-1-semialdehyde aminotransferase
VAAGLAAEVLVMAAGGDRTVAIGHHNAAAVQLQANDAALLRAAMRRILDDHGCALVVGRLAHAVSVELVNGGTRDADARLGRMASGAEDAVLYALVHFARSNGWRPPR